MLEGSLIEYWEGFAHFVAVKSGEYMTWHIPLVLLIFTGIP